MHKFKFPRIATRGSSHGHISSGIRKGGHASLKDPSYFPFSAARHRERERNRIPTREKTSGEENDEKKGGDARSGRGRRKYGGETPSWKGRKKTQPAGRGKSKKRGEGEGGSRKEKGEKERRRGRSKRRGREKLGGEEGRKRKIHRRVKKEGVEEWGWHGWRRRWKGKGEPRWSHRSVFGGIAKSEFLLPLLSLPDAETLPRSSPFKRAADVLYDHSRARRQLRSSPEGKCA